MDERIEGWLQITSAPLAVFASVPQDQFVSQLRSQGAVVSPHGEKTILSRIPSTPFHVSTLAEALSACEVNEVIVYSYGFKCPLDLLRAQIGESIIADPLNRFDIGRMFDGPDILVFDVESDIPNCRKYPNFKYLGDGYGGLEWRVSDVQLTLYQRTTHVWKAMGDFRLPTTYRTVHTFEEKLRRLLDNYQEHRGRLGGARIEAHLMCHDLDEAFFHAAPLLDIEELQSRGLLIRRINVDAYLGTFNLALAFASNLRLFVGRNEKKVNKRRRCVMADLMSLGGMTFPWLREFTNSTGLDPHLFDIWRAWVSTDDPQEFTVYNIEDMYLRLKIAHAKRTPSYTLSIRGGRGSWARRVGYGLDVRDFYDLCSILDALVQEIVKEGQTRWFEIFVLEENISDTRRLATRYLHLVNRGFTGRPASLDELVVAMDVFETGRISEHSEPGSPQSIAPSPTSRYLSMPAGSDVSLDDDILPEIDTHYSRRREREFTPEQDALIRRRVAVFGTGRIRWNDVYDATLFPQFDKEQVRNRYRWLIASSGTGG